MDKFVVRQSCNMRKKIYIRYLLFASYLGHIWLCIMKVNVYTTSAAGLGKLYQLYTQLYLLIKIRSF